MYRTLKARKNLHCLEKKNFVDPNPLSIQAPTSLNNLKPRTDMYIFLVFIDIVNEIFIFGCINQLEKNINPSIISKSFLS